MPERPISCSECKKPIVITYTEIVGETMTRTVMCADCPELEKRLYGKVRVETPEGEAVAADLACARCGTTYESIRVGRPLGCPSCYEVFADVIIDDLIKRKKISRHLTANKKTMPLHMGRAPGATTEINPTLHLIALNEALDETLIQEDYETAASLRDQIRALKEKMEEYERKE